MADLKLTVDFTDVTRSIGTIEQSKQAVKSLATAYAAGAGQQQYARGINQIVSAQKQLPPAMRMTTQEIVRLGKEYKQQAEFARELTRVNSQVAASMQRNTRGINGMGVQLQQTGYQVGDFIVQVQSGTNAFVAFGQQATQMAGTLTLLGGKYVAIGSALGVAIPLTTALAAAWMRTREEQDKTTESTKRLEDSIKSLDNTLEDWVLSKRAASAGLTTDELLGTQEIREAEEELQRARKALEEYEEVVTSPGFGAAGGIDVVGIYKRLLGEDPESQVVAALKRVRKAEDRLRELQAQQRQKAREEAEEELNNAWAKQIRDQAQAEYEAGQKTIAERRAWVLEATQIFRDAQKRMRDEEVAKTERTLEALFRSRTLYYTIRFAGEETVMSQPVAPSGGKLNPGKSYEELLALGVPHDNLVAMGLSPKKTGGGGGRKTLGDIIADKARQIEQEERIAKLSGETARIEEIKVEIQRQYGRELTATQAKAVEAAAADIAAKEQTLKSLQDLKEQQESLASTIESSMEDAFMSIVDGTKSTGDAFKDMARSIIAELYRVLVVQRLVGSWDSKSQSGTGLVGMLVGGLTGKMESGGSVRSGGSYLVGERGPELFTPGRSGTITSNNLMKSGGQQEVAVRVYVDNDGNFQAMVDQRANRAVANAAPAIVNQSVGAVVERTKRGGSMKSTFK